MRWSATGGAGAVMTFLVVAVGVGLLVFAITFSERREDQRLPANRNKDLRPLHTALRRARITLVILVPLVIGISGISSLGANPHHDDRISMSQVSALFGLESDKAYPFLLGDKISGSSGTAYASSGYFSRAVAVSIQPASAITVGFTARGRSYILEVPASKITFVQRETASPTVQVHFEGAGDFKAHWTYRYSGCSFEIINLVPSCIKTLDFVELVPNEDTARRGLAELVAEGLESAVITLTPNQYRALVGAPTE